MASSFLICAIMSSLLLKSVQPSDFTERFNWKDSPQIQSVNAKDVVRCLEAFSKHRETHLSHTHFVFMGDSRIRHLYYSFTQAFPDYDFNWQSTSMREWAGHHDNSVSSSLLNLTISFKWCPYVTDSFEVISSWLISPNEAPHWLIMGMTSWHIHFNENPQGSFENFKTSLHHLTPLITKLGETSQILWLNQLPIGDSFAKLFCVKCYQATIERYNLAARQILRDTGVVIWDSDSQLGMEYVRSCTLNNRDDMLLYWNCPDFIHTGYVALNSRSKLLLHFMCNRRNF